MINVVIRLLGVSSYRSLILVNLAPYTSVLLLLDHEDELNLPPKQFSLVFVARMVSRQLELLVDDDVAMDMK